MDIMAAQETSTNASERSLIVIDSISKIPDSYPEEFNDFCRANNLKPPKINSGNGKALAAMLANPSSYFDRDTCDKFVDKFDIKTRDSIQLFNKHYGFGIQTSSERGKNYIVYPYCLSKKHKMRKNFNFDGTEEEKNNEINKIKSSIQSDYIDVGNSEWQLGHKNPDSEDNTSSNLVLQPPIQAKYRDNYIFIDTITKIPVPKKMKTMIEKGEINLSNDQIIGYYELFDNLRQRII